MLNSFSPDPDTRVTEIEVQPRDVKSNGAPPTQDGGFSSTEEGLPDHVEKNPNSFSPDKTLDHIIDPDPLAEVGDCAKLVGATPNLSSAAVPAAALKAAPVASNNDGILLPSSYSRIQTAIARSLSDYDHTPADEQPIFEIEDVEHSYKNTEVAKTATKVTASEAQPPKPAAVIPNPDFKFPEEEELINNSKFWLTQRQKEAEQRGGALDEKRLGQLYNNINQDPQDAELLRGIKNMGDMRERFAGVPTYSRAAFYMSRDRNKYVDRTDSSRVTSIHDEEIEGVLLYNPSP